MASSSSRRRCDTPRSRDYGTGSRCRRLIGLSILSGHSMLLRLWSLEHGVFEGSNDCLGQSPLCTDHSSSKFIVNSLARYVLRLLPAILYHLRKRRHCSAALVADNASLRLKT